MAEYINKAELWDKVNTECEKKFSERPSLKEVIDNLPIIDIVHCSECVHRREYEEYNRNHDSFDLCVDCEIDGKYHDDDYFCAYGEEKNND